MAYALAQHIDNGENVMVIFLESRVKTILTKIRLSSYSQTMTRFCGKFFLAGVCSSFTSSFISRRFSELFFSDITVSDTVLFIYSCYLLNLWKLIYH